MPSAQDKKLITLKIDQEFHDLIRPLFKSEYLQLEANLISDGSAVQINKRLAPDSETVTYACTVMSPKILVLTQRCPTLNLPLEYVQAKSSNDSWAPLLQGRPLFPVRAGGKS